jgi:hypothetical protein
VCAIGREGDDTKWKIYGVSESIYVSLRDFFTSSMKLKRKIGTAINMVPVMMFSLMKMVMI